MTSRILTYLMLFFLIFQLESNAQKTILENSIEVLNLKGCTKQNGRIQLKGDGNYENHKASFSSETCLEEIDLAFDVEIIGFDSTKSIQFAIGKQSKLAGTLVEFHVRNGRSYLVVNRMDNTSLIHAAKIFLPFTFRAGEEYNIRVGKRIRNLQIEINSSVEHYYNDSLNYPATIYGLFWGTPFIACKHGEIAVNEFVLSTSFNDKPRLAVWGDSFVEGSSLSNPEERYVSMIAKRIGHENISIMGRGGETSGTLNSRIRKEIEWFGEAKFGLLAIGVNDKNFDAWKKEIQKDIVEMRKENIIPILATLSPRSDRNNYIKDVNKWIRTDYQGAYIDISKAVSRNDRLWLPGMCMNDSIHPTMAGHEAMFERIKMDAPFLFNSKSLFSVDFMNERTNERVKSNFKYCDDTDFLNFHSGDNKRISVRPGSVVYFKDTTSVNSGVFSDILVIPQRPEPPMNDTGNSEPGTFDWVFNPEFEMVSDYEFSLDKGQTWKTCTKKPIRNSSVSVVHIRIKATSENFKSSVQYLYSLN